jgi:hypothetical protein
MPRHYLLQHKHTTPTERIVMPKPWICIEGDIARDSVMKKLFEHLHARLYLFYFKKSGNAYWPIKKVAEQWKKMRTCLAATASYPTAPPPVLVELCAATHGCRSGGLNWTACDQTARHQSPFPDHKPQQHPYALWILAVGTELVYASGNSDHLWALNDDNEIVDAGADSAEDEQETEDQEASDTDSLDDSVIASCAVPADGRTGIDKITPNTVLPLALALRWLLKHKPCDTKAAIQSSGLIKELCRDKAPTPASAETPAPSSGNQ